METPKYIYDDGGREAAGFKGSTGDCVCRSIAIASGKSYEEVYYGMIDMTAKMIQSKRVRGSHPRTGVHKNIYQKYLAQDGWKWHPCMTIGSGCKVHLRADELPAGRIICRVSRHMVAVVDGVIHDMYDCSRGGTRCVYGYYYREGGQDGQGN